MDHMVGEDRANIGKCSYWQPQNTTDMHTLAYIFRCHSYKYKRNLINKKNISTEIDINIKKYLKKINWSSYCEFM